MKGVTYFIELSRQYGRYGYRKIAALLSQADWPVNHIESWRRYFNSVRPCSSLG